MPSYRLGSTVASIPARTITNENAPPSHSIPTRLPTRRKTAKSALTPASALNASNSVLMTGQPVASTSKAVAMSAEIPTPPPSQSHSHSQSPGEKPPTSPPNPTNTSRKARRSLAPAPSSAGKSTKPSPMKFTRPASRRQSTPLPVPNQIIERAPSPTSDSDDPLLLKGPFEFEIERERSRSVSRARSRSRSRSVAPSATGSARKSDGAARRQREWVDRSSEADGYEEEVKEEEERDLGGMEADWVHQPGPLPESEREGEPDLDAFRGHGGVVSDSEQDDLPLTSAELEASSCRRETLSDKLRAFEEEEQSEEVNRGPMPDGREPEKEVVPHAIGQDSDVASPQMGNVAEAENVSPPINDTEPLHSAADALGRSESETRDTFAIPSDVAQLPEEHHELHEEAEINTQRSYSPAHSRSSSSDSDDDSANDDLDEYEPSREYSVPLPPLSSPPSRRTSLVSMRVPTPRRTFPQVTEGRGPHERESSFASEAYDVSQRSDRTAWNEPSSEDVGGRWSWQQKGKGRMASQSGSESEQEEEEVLTSLPPTSDMDAEEVPSWRREVLSDASPEGKTLGAAIELVDHWSSPAARPASEDGVTRQASPPKGTRSPAVLRDVRMASPSPARLTFSAPDVPMASNSPLLSRPSAPLHSIEKLRLAAKVTIGKQVLAKKLPFFLDGGAAAPCPALPEAGDLFSIAERSVANLSTSMVQSTIAPRSVHAHPPQPASQTSVSEYRFERPLPVDPSPPPAPKAGPSTSTPLMRGQRRSLVLTPDVEAITAGSVRSRSSRAPSTSLSRRSLRARPSHPTLPVVEISSTDPKAAARATAILKVYHEYVEQGLEVPKRRREKSMSFISASQQERSDEEDDSDDDAEEEEGEKQSLLNVAVEDLRHRSPSIVIPGAFGPLTPTPASSRVADPASSPTTPTIPLRAMMASWTSAEWRRLETAVVDQGKIARREKRALGHQEILDAFLEEEGLEHAQCRDDWALNKLLVRIKALQERRARDLERRSQVSTSMQSTTSFLAAPGPPSLDSELRRAEQTFSPADTTRASVGSEARHVDEDDSNSESGPSLGDASESDGVEDEDGFGEEQEAVQYTSGLQDGDSLTDGDEDGSEDEEHTSPVDPPPALASSRFAHLYDNDASKPNAPSRPREQTPEPSGSVVAAGSNAGTPSSARKFISYIGSFIRAASAERSGSGSPKVSRFSNEMREAKTGSRPILLPSQAPRLDRRVRSLPPRASAVLDSGDTSFLPRSISGEGRVWSQIAQLEEAESSREEDSRFLRSLMPSQSLKRPSTEDEEEARGKKKLIGLGRETVVGDKPAMIPAGTRALDRPIGSKLPRRKGF